MLIDAIPEDSSNDYEISLSNILKDPRRVNSGEKFVEGLSEFDSTRDNLSDSDLDLTVKLAKKSDRTPEESEMLDNMLNKVMNYLMLRCKTLEAKYIKDPFQEMILSIRNIVKISLESGITTADIKEADTIESTKDSRTNKEMDYE